MYATKPRSLFKSHPEAASMPPPEGRNSGYLVVKGAAAAGEDDDQTCCWGSCSDTRVWELPFPQNRVLTVRYSDDEEDIVFVPVPDQPLASNRYYAVIAKGRSRGLVQACSREEDMAACCFCHCIRDVKPRPFDPSDIYQQIEIDQRRRGYFTARAVAADGFPPSHYRGKYWEVYATKPKNFDLGEALGLEDALRSRQLAGTGPTSLLDPFPAPVTVGRWYCPFYLIKEDGVSPRKQMDRSTFYEVTLEQRWEPVNEHDDGSKLASKKAFIGGSVEAKQDGGSPRHGDAYVWFTAAASGQRIGMCTSVWERMRWVENRGGWVDVEDDDGTVAGGAVLVERFVVKRMDGTLAVAFDFMHLNKVRAHQL